jgi:hypothetical protein
MAYVRNMLAYALKTPWNLALVSGTLIGTCSCPIISQRKVVMHQLPANLFLAIYVWLLENVTLLI